jgi:DNA modification methylase
MTYAVARSRDANGELNKLYAEDRAVHDWYRFVLAFPPHLVRDYLKRFGVRSSDLVLDPFCGTGTVVVECKKLGIPSVGIEPNPMAHFAGSVKTDWSPDPDGLLTHARWVAHETLAELAQQGIEEEPFLHADPSRLPTLQILPPAATALLLRNSISPLPLHKTLVLLGALERCPSDDYLAHERLALAKAVVHSISNLHFGPEVGVGPLKHDVPVVSTWLACLDRMARDLKELACMHETPTTVMGADSREIVKALQPTSVDVVITSPPYPNEKDYTRTTRLESVLLGFLRDKAQLRALKQKLVRSNTRGVYKDDDDDQWIAEHMETQCIAEAIEARRVELGKTSGFERVYARVTKLYFGGMARHLAELRTVLRPGARLAYVVGDQASYLRVMIRTGQMLADIGQSLGYEVIGIDLFRTRLATATREQLREEVVLLRWPGQTQ